MRNLFLLATALACFTCSAYGQDAKTEVKAEAGEEAKTAEPKLDFGDGASSTLTTKAWDSLTAKNYDHAIIFTKKCIKTYEKEALKMQASLKAPVDSEDEEAVHELWALNDVGTCYFILGQALEKKDKSDDAMVAYKALGKKVAFAQCWDPNGWFWKPVDAAKKRIKVLEFEKLEKEESK